MSHKFRFSCPFLDDWPLRMDVRSAGENCEVESNCLKNNLALLWLLLFNSIRVQLPIDCCFPPSSCHCKATSKASNYHIYFRISIILTPFSPSSLCLYSFFERCAFFVVPTLGSWFDKHRNHVSWLFACIAVVILTS